jgi:hypothetical protein
MPAAHSIVQDGSAVSIEIRLTQAYSVYGHDQNSHVSWPTVYAWLTATAVGLWWRCGQQPYERYVGPSVPRGLARHEASAHQAAGESTRSAKRLLERSFRRDVGQKNVWSEAHKPTREG